jgi:hypothetical protein
MRHDEPIPLRPSYLELFGFLIPSAAWILFLFRPGDEDGKADLEAEDFQCIVLDRKMLWKLNLTTESYL